MLGFPFSEDRWLPHAAMRLHIRYYFIGLILIFAHTRIVTDITIDIDIEIGTIELVCLVFCLSLY